MDDLIERLRKLIDDRCGGGPSGHNYDPELLDVLTEAAAALEAAREDAWQPIETAPKDGTGVLGFISPTWIEGIFWNGEDWSYLSDGDITPSGRNVPTHWMPLPAPPKEAREE